MKKGVVIFLALAGLMSAVDARHRRRPTPSPSPTFAPSPTITPFPEPSPTPTPPPEDSTTMTLSWDTNVPSDQVQGYRVYYLPPSGLKIFVTQTVAPRFVFPRVHGTFSFAVTAFNSAGESEFSQTIIAQN